jgi:hypothetical protein
MAITAVSNVDSIGTQARMRTQNNSLRTTPASYLGSLRFRSWSIERLSWLNFSSFSSALPTKYQDNDLHQATSISIYSYDSQIDQLLDTAYMHTYCPDCALVTFWEVRRKGNFAHVGIKCTYGQLYNYTHEVLHSKSKLQHTLKLSTAAWPLRLICCRPAGMFRHLRLTALSFPQRKIRHSFQKIYYSIFFYLFLNL